jgi:hypothetical protein
MDDSDFSTTGTGTVTLASAANLNDVVNVVSFETNIPDSNYVPASGGTFTGNITASGTLGVTGAVTAANGLTVDDDGATPLTVDRATNDGAVIDVQRDGVSIGGITTNAGKLVVNSQGSNLTFAVGGTSKANMDGSQFYPQTDGGLNLSHPSVRWQDLYLSGGAYIGGTGAANKLDDYEEGVTTWPDAGYANSGGGLQFTFLSGSTRIYNQLTYTKIGRSVTVSGMLIMGGHTGADGQIRIPLPFAAVTGTGQLSDRYCCALHATTMPDADHSYNVSIRGGGVSYANIQESGVGTDGGSLRSSSQFGSSGNRLQFTLTYMTA